MAILSFYRRLPLQKPSIAGYYADRMLQLSGQPLSLRQIATIADGVPSGAVRIQISAAAIAQRDAARHVVPRVAEEFPPVYGINTGFGKLCEVPISNGELNRLNSTSC